MSVVDPLTPAEARTRGDLCPGVTRPWAAADGGLVRLRLVGGRIRVAQLRSLLGVAGAFGDGTVHLTRRANLQVRGLGLNDGILEPAAEAAVIATGLVPSRSHELVRNILVSPLSGIEGGRADLRVVAAELDRGLSDDDTYAALSARFLFVLDDGRGDVLHRSADVALVALDDATAQIRWGSHWSAPLALSEAVPAMLAVARAFVAARGTGPDAPWHIAELPGDLVVDTLAVGEPDGRVPAASEPPAYGTVAGLRHLPVPDALLTAALADDLLAGLGDDAEIVVTPWRSLLIPSPPTQPTRRFAYEGDGAAIYVDSFATIRAETDLSHVPPDAEKVVVRMVHGTGQTDLASQVVVSTDLVSAARAALESGAPIIADAHMVASGITRARLPRDNEVLCALRDPQVPALAKAWETTRSAAALSVLADRIGGSVIAIGNAPTALFHLLEMLADGCAPPAAIIGCPVGFIGAAESKEALAQYASAQQIPFLTVHGRRGGSAMTASALNAIAQEKE